MCGGTGLRLGGICRGGGGCGCERRAEGVMNARSGGCASSGRAGIVG